MKKQRKKPANTIPPKRWDVMLGTTFGAGFWPWGPGTAGAAVGVLIWMCYAYCIDNYLIVTAITMSLSIIFTLISLKPIDRLELSWGEDPSKVVIDETVGVWITLLAVPATREWYYAFLAFVLFRIMDIVKPLGCRWLDNNIHGGLGVMLDDILAGIYGGIVLMLLTLVL